MFFKNVAVIIISKRRNKIFQNTPNKQVKTINIIILLFSKISTTRNTTKTYFPEAHCVPNQKKASF